MEKSVINQLQKIHGVRHVIKVGSVFDIIAKIESNSRVHLNSIVGQKINNITFVKSVTVLCVKN